MADTDAQPVFRCPKCERSYGDPLYHGPIGHAPQNLCLDCWADDWSEIEARMVNGGEWSVLDSLLWLICYGLSRRQVGFVMKIHRNTLHNWLIHLRRNPHEIPEWLVRNAAETRLYA